jgi:hypothetical protein
MPDHPPPDDFKSAAAKGCLLVTAIVSVQAIGGMIGLLMFYGVVLLIFRHAFGVELPNPLYWLR